MLGNIRETSSTFICKNTTDQEKIISFFFHDVPLTVSALWSFKIIATWLWNDLPVLIPSFGLFDSFKSFHVLKFLLLQCNSMC